MGECEAVSGYPGAGLEGVVDSQVREFASLMHEEEMRKLAQMMEAEKWERVEFRSEDAVVLANVIQSATIDPPAWLPYTQVANTSSPEANKRAFQSTGILKEPTFASQHNKKDPTPAIVKNEKFFLTNSTAFALHEIQHYTILLTSIPSLATTVSKLLFAYLALFNSRTQQLILGAGAIRTARLPNINTKHLALASQSLSFFIALASYLHKCVRRRPSITDSDMAGYDSLGQVLQDHRSAIHDKFIGTMTSRATLCIKEIRNIDWDDGGEVEKDVSPHVETLMLRRVLRRYFPGVSVSLIVEQVFRVYKESWSEAFKMWCY